MEQTTLTLQMLSEKQVANILKISVALLRRWRKLRCGPKFCHLGRCVRYDVRVIERFVTEHSSGNNQHVDSASARSNQVSGAR
jgi:hypothetical protein